MGIPGGRSYNILWNDWLNMRNLLDVSEIVGISALERKESRGAHYRSDFPKKNNREYLKNFFVRRKVADNRRSGREVYRLTPNIGFDEPGFHR